MEDLHWADTSSLLLLQSLFRLAEKYRILFIVVVPPTINDLLIARIDRLEEKTRELVKVASVIGRNFFDRILKEVAASIEGIDDRLAYLKDLELIRDRIRMEELEHFFKHALAQEAAYESTLLQQRKSLHVKVAQSIERLFQERLHEFYALLAFHYSKADDLEKAEEYLIKAGEEALRSSASSEALRLYLDKHGTAADLEKVAQVEKNIAFALLSRGQYLESYQYGYRALEHFKVILPRYRARDVYRILWNWVAALKSIYFPKHLWGGVPRDQNSDICKTMLYMGMSLSVPNPRAFFITAMPAAIKWLSKFDVRKLEYGLVLHFAISCAFAWGGLFTLAEKMLQIIKAKTDIVGPVEKLYYESTEYHIKFLKGIAWEKGAQDFGYDEDLIEQNIELGQIWWATMMMQYYAMKKIGVFPVRLRNEK
jgi:hypothetical protein